MDFLNELAINSPIKIVIFADFICTYFDTIVSILNIFVMLYPNDKQTGTNSFSSSELMIPWRNTPALAYFFPYRLQFSSVVSSLLLEQLPSFAIDVAALSFHACRLIYEDSDMDDVS